MCNYLYTLSELTFLSLLDTRSTAGKPSVVHTWLLRVSSPKTSSADEKSDNKTG